MESEDPDYFQKLGAGHTPTYMWIGCSDARVPANEVMGEDAGSVFVLRSVANLVVNTDFNLMSALQFAVDYLKIPHIICLRSLWLRWREGVHFNQGPHASSGKLAAKYSWCVPSS